MTEHAGTCSAVDPIDPTEECEAPAAIGGRGGYYVCDDTVRTKCYACGQFVCKACSSVIPWKSRERQRRRICRPCQVEAGLAS